MADSNTTSPVSITIKKYANRRLYNTATSSYVTLDHLCEMVKEGVEFTVHDAKTGEDITRSVLTQIIVEEEGKGQNLLPISFLRQLIGFYGDNMQRMLLPSYLEASMKAFSHNQERMQDYLKEAFGVPFGNMEEMGRQNMAMFERAMQIFNPFAGGVPGQQPDRAEKPAEPARAQGTGAAPQGGDKIADLERKLEEMSAKLAQLSDGKK